MSFKSVDLVKGLSFSKILKCGDGNLSLKTPVRWNIWESTEAVSFLKPHQVNLDSSRFIVTDKGQIEQSVNELSLKWLKAFLLSWREWPVEGCVFLNAEFANKLHHCLKAP